MINLLIYYLKYDNGSPIWQFSSGRAVLVGIRVGVSPKLIVPAIRKPYDHGGSHCDDRPNSLGINLRVNKFIDWIRRNTKFN